MGKALIIRNTSFAVQSCATFDLGVLTPTIDIQSDGTVTISSVNTVYYTTDGTMPTNESTLYTSSFSVAEGTTIIAIAYEGRNHSTTIAQTYNSKPSAPSMSVTSSGTVTILSTSDVYYTTDGTAPTTDSTKYNGKFKVSDGTIVKAVAYGNDTYSDVSQLTVVVTNEIVQSDWIATTADIYDCDLTNIKVTGGGSLYWEISEVLDYSSYGEMIEELNDSGTRQNYWGLTRLNRTITLKTTTTKLRVRIRKGVTMILKVNDVTLFEFDGYEIV